MIADLVMNLDNVTSMIEPRKKGGSQVGRKFVQHNRLVGHELLVADYFADQPVYDAVLFQCRFRMWTELFLCIVDSVIHFDPYCEQRVGDIGQMGLSALQKCTPRHKCLPMGELDMAHMNTAALGRAQLQKP
jgi:hypothetical protein